MSPQAPLGDPMALADETRGRRVARPPQREALWEELDELEVVQELPMRACNYVQVFWVRGFNDTPQALLMPATVDPWGLMHPMH